MNTRHPVHRDSDSPLSSSSQIEETQIFEILGDSLRRIFTIWNRGYKPMCIVAVDVNEALHIAFASRHIKRVQQYRRFEDITDKCLESRAVEGLGEIDHLESLLGMGKSGQISRLPDGDWAIGGETFKEK